MAIAEPNVEITPSGLGILEASGLPESVVVDLLLRHFGRASGLRATEAASRIGLPLSSLAPLLDSLRALRLLDVSGRGVFDAGIEYLLTEAGRSRSRHAFERCQYLGPLPVSLAEYSDRVEQQSIRRLTVDETRLREAIGDAVVSPELVAQLGAALVSDRALYLYGASGTGKTFLAERLFDALSGEIDVPHARCSLTEKSFRSTTLSCTGRWGPTRVAGPQALCRHKIIAGCEPGARWSSLVAS